MRQIVVFAAACMLLTACGGGGTTAVSNSAAGSPAVPVVHARTGVTFTLKVPAGSRSSGATRRKPQYVSVSTQSLVVTLTAQNGAPVSSPQPYAVNISSCPLVSSVTTCSLAVPASVGADTFTVATYDAAQSSATPATLAGSLLSTASASTTVVLDTANTFALTLSGVVHSIVLALSNATPPSGTAATIGLTVTAEDADGNVIVGPGSYNVPIALTNSDTSGATTLSTTSLASPATAVTVAYTGVPASASFSASASGAIATTAVALHTQVTRIAVSEYYSPHDVKVFNRSGSSFVLAQTISAGLAEPTGMAFDPSGNLFVADANSDTVTKYSPSGAGPISTLNSVGYPYAFALGATGKMYVTNAYSSPPSIGIYAANATNAAAPVQTINLPVGFYPYAVAVDATGKVYTAQDQSNFLVYSAAGALLATVTAGGLDYVAGVAVDPSGKIYAANNDGGSGNQGFIATYTPGFALTTPLITAGLAGPSAIAVDQGSNVYVDNYGVSIEIYAPNGTLSSTPITGLAGSYGIAVY